MMWLVRCVLIVTLVPMLVTLCCSAVSEELEEGANDVLVEKDSSAVSEGDKLLLEAYHHSWDDAKVDLDLVLSLLHLIHSAKRDGESSTGLSSSSSSLTRTWLSVHALLLPSCTLVCRFTRTVRDFQYVFPSRSVTFMSLHLRELSWVLLGR